MAPNPRLISAQIIYQVAEKGQSLDAALEAAIEPGSRDSALIQEIVYGVIRHYFSLNYIANQLLGKPLRNKDRDVSMLILAGLYQLTLMRIPSHAAVSETVSAVRGLKKPWARGLVNAVLREYQRRDKELLRSTCTRTETASNHPRWLLKQIFKSWPSDFKALISANNARAPMSLRVNAARHVSVEHYLAEPIRHDITGKADPEISSAIELAVPAPVDQLPGFYNGLVSVQDKSAQQAGFLLDVVPGQRVLDACAAPGGKTCHLLEIAGGDLDLVALDISEKRLDRVQQNLKRLGFSATLCTGDATEPDHWWNGQLFDRILLDAPCSGTGVIRRHPDIKLHRRPDDIEKLARLQSRMLSSLWKLLAPGGKLLYCTCSILPVENDLQLSSFLEQHNDAEKIDISPAYTCSLPAGHQVLTGTNGMDGFYYGCIQKSAR